MEFKQVFSAETKERFKQEFGHNKEVYLDHAGACLVSKSHLEATFKDLTDNLYCNPHTSGDFVNEVRLKVLRAVNADPSIYTLVWTSGATAACKLVAENLDIDKFAYLTESHTSVIGMREYFNNVQAIDRNSVMEKTLCSCKNNSSTLFAFPAMSNFCGKKFPVKDWLQALCSCCWLTFLDAACLVSTCRLDLEEIKPDFVCISFYKMFGFPTGIGALIAKKSSLKRLRKKYFGGGTVDMALIHSNVHNPKEDSVEESLEDGTVNFQGIIGVMHGFDVLKKLVPEGIECSSSHIYNLAEYLAKNLSDLMYLNGQSLVKMYSDFSVGIEGQGGIVTFNLLGPRGNYLGYSAFNRIAKMNRLIVRVGCFCNLGGCQNYLGTSDDDIVSFHKMGHKCGSPAMDVINGKPTGAIRVSIGFYSTLEDVNFLLKVLTENYLTSLPEKCETSSISSPTLSAIYVYPVKSLAPMAVKRWPVGNGGLLHDRSFVIMQGSKVLTQKVLPMLCLIKPTIDLEAQTLTLSYEGEPSLVLDLVPSSGTDAKGAMCTTRVCKDTIKGIDMGQAVSDWLEVVTGMLDLRLVKVHSRDSKMSKSSANDSPFLVLNLASIRMLGQTIQDKEEGWTDEWLIEQFRGNLVIAGPKTFDEDDWKNLTFLSDDGSFTLKMDGPCRRCTMISIDQTSGESVQEPFRTLSKWNRNFNFGVLASISNCNGGGSHFAVSSSSTTKLKIGK